MARYGIPRSQLDIPIVWYDSRNSKVYIKRRDQKALPYQPLFQHSSPSPSNKLQAGEELETIWPFHYQLAANAVYSGIKNLPHCQPIPAHLNLPPPLDPPLVTSLSQLGDLNELVVPELFGLRRVVDQKGKIVYINMRTRQVLVPAEHAKTDTRSGRGEVRGWKPKGTPGSVDQTSHGSKAPKKQIDQTGPGNAQMNVSLLVSLCPTD
jgi:hypothetical protein